MKKYTNEQIKNMVSSLTQGEYEKLNDIYLGASIKFPIRHNICGFKYEVSWNKFQMGNRCAKCYGNLRLNHDEIVIRIHNLVGDEYKKLDQFYVNSNTKFPVKHIKCGHVYVVSWDRFQGGNRCPKCSKKESARKRKLTNSEIVKRIYELVGSEYEKLTLEYRNSSSKFPIKHNKCGQEYEVSWGNFKSGSRCPKCVRNSRNKRLFWKEENHEEKID